MQLLGLPAPGGDQPPGLLQLLQVENLDRQVELAQGLWAEVELAALEASVLQGPLVPEVAEERVQIPAERDVACGVAEVEPDVVGVHVVPIPAVRPGDALAPAPAPGGRSSADGSKRYLPPARGIFQAAGSRGPGRGLGVTGASGPYRPRS